MPITTDAEILEAALEQFALTGITRTSTDEIARAAGVNRATIYRRFGTREEFLAAAYLHEAGRVLADLTERLPQVPQGPDRDFDPAASLVVTFTEAVSVMRQNRVLRKLLELDPVLALVGMTAGASDVLRFAADVIAAHIVDLHQWRGTEPPADPHLLGLTTARLIHSLVLTPDAGPDLDSTESAEAYVREVIAPLLLGR